MKQKNKSAIKSWELGRMASKNFGWFCEIEPFFLSEMGQNEGKLSSIIDVDFIKSRELGQMTSNFKE